MLAARAAATSILNNSETLMKQVTGQILRLGGLFIEMLGVLGIVTGNHDVGAARLRLPGGTMVAPAWIAVALGFVIWLLGTFLAYGSRPSRS
jgi:hypothetical protein